jgi:2-polyprenyl-3-methyl-5-hydroxy-6-metoxy-1,4-benzoquinol methylase
MKVIPTAERVSTNKVSDNYVFQRCLFPYKACADMISGKVLEIGTGEGYGIQEIAPRVDQFITIDKYRPNIDFLNFPNLEFKQMQIPPFKDIPDGYFDYAISFQVIEHIKNDNAFVAELSRVLKKGGSTIITTPNKKMSLTVNPWHVREYTINELETLLLKHFKSVKKMGLFGNKKVMDYYEKNKKSIEKFKKYDILNLENNLPRQLLQIPYDLLNMWNRKKLLQSNYSLTADISLADYFLEEPSDACLDLFYIATNE